MSDSNLPPTAAGSYSSVAQQPVQQSGFPPAPAPEPKKSSGLGVAALVLGIVALVFAFIPIANYFGMVLAVVGLGLGIVGLVLKGRSKGLPLTGTILSGLALLLAIMMAVIYAAVFSAAVKAVDDAGTNILSTSAASAAGGASHASAPQASDYAVAIKGATFGKDYDGTKAIIVTYAFTNNSSSAQSFAFAVDAEAYQGGVALEDAIGVDGVDTSVQLADVKPGVTATVQVAYDLRDTSTVSVEVEDLINKAFNNGSPLAKQTFPVS